MQSKFVVGLFCGKQTNKRSFSHLHFFKNKEEITALVSFLVGWNNNYLQLCAPGHGSDARTSVPTDSRVRSGLTLVKCLYLCLIEKILNRLSSNLSHFLQIVYLCSTLIYKITSFSFSLLLNYLESGDPHNWKGIVLAVALFLVNVTETMLVQNFLFYAQTAGIRVRSVLNSTVYRKV